MNTPDVASWATWDMAIDPPPELTPKQLLETRCVALIVNVIPGTHENGWRTTPSWLQKSFVKDGINPARRQELPTEALLPADQAAEQVDKDRTVAIISHGWLHPKHPDPLCKRVYCQSSRLNTSR